MSSEWRCGECNESGEIESEKIHGVDLLLAIRKSHQQISPQCSVSDPLYCTVGPLPANKRILFLENHLERQVRRLEAEARVKELEPTFLAVVKNEIVWLDCQLGTDGEAVEIGKRLEILKHRVSQAQRQTPERDNP